MVRLISSGRLSDRKSSNELKPCPFCGNNEVRLYFDQPDIYQNDWVVCDMCDTEGPDGKSASKAALAWNKRA